MAKITRKQVDDINARLLNGWKFDTRHFMLNGEKSVTMEIPLDEKHELSASISFYDSYECFEKIGTVVKIRVSKWENIGNGMIRSCDWGKSRAIAYTKPRKMFKDIEILTAFITKEDIMEIYNGTEETAEITNIRMNSKGLWERAKENSEPMPEAVAEITPKTGNLKPTKKRINALQQIVKANKEENRVAIQTEKVQFFGNGFMFVMLVASCFITPISEFFSNVADEFHHMARTFMNTVKAAEAETGEKLQLPTLQKLKEIKRVCKLNDGKSIVDFGEKMPCVNADFLRKVLESLSGKVEAWKRGYNIYLKDEYGNTAYIMGIQLKPEVKREFWGDTLERNRKLEEELRKQEETEKQENSIEESAPVAENSIDINAFLKKFNENYEFLYEHHDNVAGYSEALECGNMIISSDTEKSQALIKTYINTMHDFISSDREIAALAFTLDDLGIIDEYLPMEQPESENPKGESIMNNTENSIMNDNNIMHNIAEEQPTAEEPKTAWTGRTDYAERRAEKAERYAERAEKARATADRLQKPINNMHGDIAFFTQPNINTSAGRAFTNQRNRMFASYEKGFEERDKAAYYDEKSENLSKEPTAISSDDPEALRKLKDKLEKLTAEHKEHLAHNKALKKAIKDGTAETNKFGWATLNGKSYYFTTNETAEIRRLKDRIEELENLEVPENYSFDGGTVVFNVAENRVQILFDEIPDSETRENLKRNGFKWSPRQQAWQRMLNTTGIRTVKRLYPMPEKPTEENSVEETSQPTTENIVYPFILIDTPTAQPKAAEEKTIEEQPTENPTVAQPVITFDETLLSKARQMYYKVYVDSISNDGINYIGSETEISGVRVRIIPDDSWDDSITFYSAEKFAEYMNRELRLESEFWSDEVAQSVEESATENHMTRKEILQAIEEETKASINPQQILFYGEKLLESVVWLDGIRNTITEIAFWKYGTGADKDFEILTIEVDRIQQNILDSLFKKETVTVKSPVEEQPVENPTVETPASYEKCERFIKEQLTGKGGMYTELFWDLAEKSGLWVRGTFGTPMSKALCNLTEVEDVMHNGKIAYSVFKLKVPYHETPEEKSTFFNADLARFIASQTLAYDEREDMAYPLFEKDYTEKHKPSEKVLFGYHLSEAELYALAEKYHNGEDITVELAKKLLNHGEEEIEIAFDNGKITDKTYHFKKEMCRKLHTEYVENGVDCCFGESDRLINFEEIGKAFIEICRNEYNDILSWREQEDSTMENQTAEPPIETITVEDTEIAVEKIPELGLKTDEEMRKTFNAVQGKINEVGTIEQKNIVYKIPWGIYRRYSAEDIINVVLAKTSDILSIKTENRFKAVSALIADNMKKSGMTAEQKAQAEIAIQYIGSPNKLNDYVCSTEENSANNSTVNGNNTTAERKIRPPPFLKDSPKIRKEKR